MTVVDLVSGKRICICVGSGGVGKTTIAAAIAAGLAADGQRVVVVTIDPARRLADALGLGALATEPQLIEPSRLSRHGIQMHGELWAMTLDPKGTFDGLVNRLAPDTATSDRILTNRIYQELSTAVAGSQEFTAVAKLHELAETGRFDAIVLDTPPSRNALDFLDAPQRLSLFFHGRATRLLMAPTSLAAGIAARGTGLVLGALRRVTGRDLLDDLDDLFESLSPLTEAFGARAAAVGDLLEDPATTFLLIASPEHLAAQEVVFFHQRLIERDLPFGGLIVNRVHPVAHTTTAPDEALLSEQLGGDDALAAKAIDALHDLHRLAERDAAVVEQLRRDLDEPHPVVIAELEADVHDLHGLAAVHRQLFASAAERRALLAAAAF